MTTAALEPPRSRWRLIAGLSLAGVLGLLSLALLLVPLQFRSQTRVYQGGGNNKPIASFTINAFVARYHQDSKAFDASSPEAAGLTYKGFTTVNTTEWSVQPRRAAPILMIAAVLVIVRMVQRHRVSRS